MFISYSFQFTVLIIVAYKIPFVAASSTIKSIEVILMATEASAIPTTNIKSKYIHEPKFLEELIDKALFPSLLMVFNRF
jgi:hypothetical protein